MSAWGDLERELDGWRSAGRLATLWWRDDDAVAHTPALAPLLDLGGRHGVPVALAVVPASLERSLVGALAAEADCTIVQHGHAHRNHAPEGARARELGDQPVDELLEQLAEGAARLRDVFGARFAPILVPPWNRIDAAIVPRLPWLGFSGLSTFGPRASRRPATNLTQCNTHADPIAWRHGRRFVGADTAVGTIVAHLTARRLGTVDADEPTGLLTHHLVFDAPTWRFVDQLFARTARHPAVRWLDVRTSFAISVPPA